jgi:hypothetical protein
VSAGLPPKVSPRGIRASTCSGENSRSCRRVRRFLFVVKGLGWTHSEGVLGRNDGCGDADAEKKCTRAVKSRWVLDEGRTTCSPTGAPQPRKN